MVNSFQLTRSARLSLVYQTTLRDGLSYPITLSDFAIVTSVYSAPRLL